jgi:hypothetical protein
LDISGSTGREGGREGERERERESKNREKLKQRERDQGIIQESAFSILLIQQCF